MCLEEMLNKIKVEAGREVWEVREISDYAKESMMNKIDQQEKSKSSRQNKPDAVDKTQPLEGCFRNVKRFLFGSVFSLELGPYWVRILPPWVLKIIGSTE